VIGRGLFTSQGELHARQRRLMQPVFRKSRIEAYAAQMSEISLRTREQWRSGEVIDLSEEMMKLTMLIGARALFAHEIESDAATVSRNLATLLDFFIRISSPFLKLQLALPLPSTLRFRKAVRDLDAVIYRVIERRRGEAGTGTDLLTLLMQAKDDETTSNLLSWTIYLLSQNPDADARLYAEAKALLGGREGFSAADCDRMPYARLVLQEGLRLYPPGWYVGRAAVNDVRVGKYTIPKGAVVIVSQYLMHRDQRFFDRPAEFIPERWDGDLLERLPRGAYFPFSAGDRHCIGEGFAWQEALLILATLVARWRFELAPGQTIRPRPSVTLRPDGPIKMILRKRD
jgi:cytochrome P450